MGTLKMLHMKQCKGKNKAKHLKNALEYIFNPEKFSQRWMGGNAGSSAHAAYENMMRLKRTMGKENGRQGYHYILTFLPGEVDENLACKITEEFCAAFLSDTYQHAYVLHTDKSHYHTHIIFNSIDMNGWKYHYEKGEWAKKIQPIVNNLCRKYGLSEIRLHKEGDEENKSKTAGEKQKKEKGKKYEKVKNQYSYKELNENGHEQPMKWREIRKGLHKQVKSDIQSAISEAFSMEEFCGIMEERHYAMRLGSSKKEGEYFTFRPEGRKGVRSYTLGAGYSPQDIRYQIENKDKIILSDASFENDDVWRKKYQSIYYHVPKDLRRLFWKNTYLIRNWNGNRLSLYPQTYKYRQSLEALRETEEEFNYIAEMGVKDIQEVNEKLHYITYKLKELGQLRFETADSENIDDVVRHERLVAITAKYKRYMKEKQILERIQKREARLREYEKEIQEEKLAERNISMSEEKKSKLT